jgi:hypothetical protein
LHVSGVWRWPDAHLRHGAGDFMMFEVADGRVSGIRSVYPLLWGDLYHLKNSGKPLIVASKESLRARNRLYIVTNCLIIFSLELFAMNQRDSHALLITLAGAVAYGCHLYDKINHLEYLPISNPVAVTVARAPVWFLAESIWSYVAALVISESLAHQMLGAYRWIFHASSLAILVTAIASLAACREN